MWLVLIGPMLCALPFTASAQPGTADQIVYEADFTTGNAQGWQPANNLKPFETHAGYLSTKATGHDANMMVTGLSLPADSISHLQFRLRSDKSGATQVYFVTTASPDPAAHVVPSVQCPGDGKWHEFEVQVGTLDGFTGTLTMLRLDPVNGGGEQAEIGLQWVRLIKKAPAIVCTGFSADKAMLAPGENATLSLNLTNFGGGFDGELAAALLATGGVTTQEPVASFRWDKNATTTIVTWPLRAEQTGLGKLYVVVRLADKPLVEARAYLPVRSALDLSVADRPSSPMGRVVGGNAVRLVFLGDPAQKASERLYGAALVSARVGDEWKDVGILSPLGLMAYRRGGVEHWKEIAFTFDDITRLAGGDGARGWRLSIDIPKPGRGDFPGCIGVNWSSGRTPGPVRRVSGPVMRVGLGAGGADKAAALFPGVEFLGENEESSNTDVVGDAVGFRPSPPPYWVTVPVLAVLKDSVLTGLMWPAVSERGEMPVAEFASPNFIDGQANHRLACFSPGQPYRAANQTVAATPSPNRIFSGSMKVFAIAGGDIVDAVPLWYHTYGLPDAPQPPHSPEEALDLCMQGWAQTLWFPEKRGFNNHWHVGQTPYWDGGLAANILAHSLRTGEKRWVEALELKSEDTLLSLTGSILQDVKRPATPAGAKTQVNGLWPYESTDEVEEKVKSWTDGKRENLGRPGSFNVGVAANQAIGLLSTALQWGDEASLEAGLKALAAMEQYRVPRGCQGWEVHIDIPDIYAAARIIDCYRMGYELTGDDRWLRRAVYWAYTGLPFLYAYEVGETGPGAAAHIPWPEDVVGEADQVFLEPSKHHVTPWASIPVFGTSFYRVSWFSNPVQWCGLCWAKSVYPLLEYVDDDLLRAAADGTVISGIHQTFDKEPYVGLLPDTWHLSSNVIHPAFIGPVRLEDPLRLLIDRPAFGRVRTSIALRKLSDEAGAAGLERVHVSSHAQVRDLTLTEDALHWRQRFVPGQVCETRLVCPRQPVEIVAGTRVLQKVDDILTAEEGWAWMPGPGVIGLRVKQAIEWEPVTVRF